MIETTLQTEPNDELEESLDKLEQEVVEELERNYGPKDDQNPNKMFSVTFPYEVYIPIRTPKDALTEVIIRTYSEEPYSAVSKTDVKNQFEHSKPYVEEIMKKRMVEYVSGVMGQVPLEEIELSYTGEPSVRKLTKEELDNFSFLEAWEDNLR